MSTDRSRLEDRSPPPAASPVAADARRVIGRQPQLQLVQAALDAGVDVILEGPPGTGKSTLLRAVSAERGVGLSLVEGNAELTPARLLGHFDPALVLERGYDPQVFVDGPLLRAMRHGRLLYVEELNRVPEETLNMLLGAMSERQVVVPRLGTVEAAAAFRFVAAMNPYDTVGTARISGALRDRTCRISMGYQSARDEREIVRQETGDRSGDPDWVARVVDLVRATREHPELSVGSSVRGAVDLVKLAPALAARRGRPVPEVGLDAALAALSGRVQVAHTSSRSAEQIITELYRQMVQGAGEPAGGPPPGKSAACPPPSPGRQAAHHRPPRHRSLPAERRISRRDLARSASFADISPGVGRLDESALRQAVSDDVEGTVVLLSRMSRATDEGLRQAVRRLAGRLVLDQVATAPTGRPGLRRRMRSRSAALDGDLDLDSSMDQLLTARAERRPVDPEDLVVSRWSRGGLAIVLVIDRSGSMTGAHLTGACVLAAACALRGPDEWGVLSFAGDVRVHRDLADAAPPDEVIDQVLSLVGHGETGLGQALRRAGEMLAADAASRRVVLLLSDCRASGAGDAGSRAVQAGAALGELLIVAPAGDAAQAHEFARLTGSRCAELTDWQDASAVLTRMLAPTTRTLPAGY